ncbi:MAG: hypothetical protein ACSHXZ_13310 [Gammaproteobacteria bacterium]
MSPDFDYEVRYLRPENINFSQISWYFQSMPLFDDVFLNMQAMNVAIVDSFITDQEYALLSKYIEIERTPGEMAMFVSAQSQMWIFALYELLRTWKQRARKLQTWKANGALNTMLKNVETDKYNLGALMRARHIEWVRDDDSAIPTLERYEKKIDPVFQMTSDIRINLAKHEIRGKPNAPVRAPGYGRINMLCGALDFQIDFGNDSFVTVNRRDIADTIRALEIET